MLGPMKCEVSHTLMIDVDLNEDLPEKKKKVEGARHSFMSNFSYLHHSWPIWWFPSFLPLHSTLYPFPPASAMFGIRYGRITFERMFLKRINFREIIF